MRAGADRLITSSRRRKTKCDGVRPRCRHCLNRNLPCVWSVPDHEAPSTPSSGHSHTGPLVLNSGEASPSLLPSPSPVARESQAGKLPGKGLQLCLDLFFKHHFANDFCSFDYRPDFEGKCRRDTTLACSVVALCGRYLSAEDAQSGFGLSSAHEVFRRYLGEARTLVKAVSDEPSGKPLRRHASTLANEV